MRWFWCFLLFLLSFSCFWHSAPALRDLGHGKDLSVFSQNKRKETLDVGGVENFTTLSPILRNHYLSNDELEILMKNISKTCSNILRLYSVGKSVQGIPLWAMEISDNPGVLEPEPSFKFVGNVHGDEPVGRELLLYLAEWLCDNYLKDILATDIVRKVHLHLLPSMNPDGFALKTRENANNVDLNRDFPDQFLSKNNDERTRQPETQAIMRWTREYRFVASASLHEGAIVANYPWDGTSDGSSTYAKCPDDSSFQYLASIYSQNHQNMLKSKEFKDGITNGAAWYPLYGGMQDWNYIHGRCLDLTLEICEVKWPPFNELLRIWEDNKKSMLNLVASLVKSGLHGKVESKSDHRPLPARIEIKGINHSIVASAKAGDYHRILAPGKHYDVTANMAGFKSQTHRINLPKDRPALLNFALEPEIGNNEFSTSNPQKGASENHKSWVEASSPMLNDAWTLTRQFWSPYSFTRIFPATSQQQKSEGVATTASKNSGDNLDFMKSLATSSRVDEKSVAQTLSDDHDPLLEVTMDHLKLSYFCVMLVVTASLFLAAIKWRSAFRFRLLRPFVKPPTKV